VLLIVCNVDVIAALAALLCERHWRRGMTKHCAGGDCDRGGVFIVVAVVADMVTHRPDPGLI